MQKIVVEPTQTAQWHALVNEAESAANLTLDETSESYLVFLLMRFTDKPEMAGSLLGQEFLEGLERSGRAGLEGLRDVGDKCLLYSGLFPRRAQRRLVKVSYFVDLGRSAYHHLHSHSGHGLSDLYGQLVASFVPMMDVLQRIRELDGNGPAMDALSAMELWQDTNSAQARRCVEEGVDTHTPIITPTSSQRTH